MNQTHSNETDALRSDIDVTRRRMDDTIDALGERMRPRHLLDEVLGYLRRPDSQGNSRFSTMRDKVSQGTDTAVHAVVDTVKSNPIPALLIAGGVAWMIFNSRRQSRSYASWETSEEDYRYDPDAHLDRPLEYPPSTAGVSEAGWSDSAIGQPVAGESGSKLGRIKDGLGQAASSAKEKISHAGEAARERFSAARERVGEFGSRVKQRTGEMYSATRDRVVTTAEEHPLEVGLACLAAGVVAGLALPTPDPVNRRLGPTADRLRDRARESGHEMLEKGKRVASAAVDAMKEEAEHQGLTPERLRQKAGAVAERGREVGKESAQREGLTSDPSGAMGSTPPSSAPTTPPPDPTVARPGI